MWVRTTNYAQQISIFLQRVRIPVDYLYIAVYFYFVVLVVSGYTGNGGMALQFIFCVLRAVSNTPGIYF